MGFALLPKDVNMPKTLIGKGYGATEPAEPCRTCKGSGKITKKDKEGIAVISYGDERLAPSRTAVYMIIAVILFLGLAGTLVILFYPRTVSAKSSQLKIVYADIQKNITKIILRDTIQLRNSNYFASTLDGINITVQYQQKEVGKNNTLYGNHTITPTIPARGESSLNYSITLNFNRDTGSDDIWTYCCLIHYSLGFQVQVVSQFSYFSNRFEFSEGIYQNANCNKVKISKPENICHLDVEGYKVADEER